LYGPSGTVRLSHPGSRAYARQEDLAKPMIGQIFLYIFRGVSMVPARPWFGGPKKYAQYFNGVSIVSLIQIAILNNVYVILTWISDLKYPANYYIFIVLLGVFYLLNSYWMILKGAGEEFIHNFGDLTDKRKATLLILAISTSIFGLVGFWIIRP
jgi:hypothetical protein